MAPSDTRKQHYRTIFLSDIHLGSRGCRADRLLDFLKSHSCDRLYLVGDIVDGWRMKRSLYWPQSHSNVVRRVLTLAKRGTEVVYVTGNHDEFLRRYSDHQFGNIVLCDRAVHVRPDGERYLVVHGDEYDVITRYHRWIAWLGDIGYSALLEINRLNNWVRERLGFGRWSLSAWVKHRVKRAVNFISEFEAGVAQDCAREGFDGVICGHIHHAEMRDVGGIRYLNCGDWVESCTALVEDEAGNIEIVHWLPETVAPAVPVSGPVSVPDFASVLDKADRAA
ncbi:MAG: UDP-2,3-diacylglucosamine diphosphatase [Pseudomonadota bacterium]|nr:UDP-2,3-diacylglucosamine diphosphatase [Pseudomonadota bacterium]